jgi:hypothetical protein
MYDAGHVPIGFVQGIDIPAQQGYSMTSRLPYTLVVTSGNVDDDPVQYAYAGASWDSNSADCSVGAYDSGSRQMDCGFTCS